MMFKVAEEEVPPAVELTLRLKTEVAFAAEAGAVKEGARTLAAESLMLGPETCVHV